MPPIRTRADYAQIIQQAYEYEKPRFAVEWDQGLRQLSSNPALFGFAPPSWMLHYALTCAFLYEQTADVRLAEEARDGLFFYRSWLGALPADARSLRPEYADGIAPMEPVFQPNIFIPAFTRIRPALSLADREELAGMLADALRPIALFPEWGGHNRAMLRAAALSGAAQALPDHPEAPAWRALADELAEESWGRWSIEDAMLYQPHWLRSLIRYAESSGREAELADQIQARMHLKAMTQLISPLGILPDFGDSHWLAHSHWEWAACLEWGARAYRDPAMKWAANRIDLAPGVLHPTGYEAAAAVLAWEWCDETVPASEPLNQADALDDLVLKKIVWRTGWDARASYACLNYRDEGRYGRAARDYLRTTLAVSAEKMHHGHADEGSFSMLVHAGTLLLHESGYREQPPDGIYRSAVYHNRVAWRSGRAPQGQNLLEFLRADGRYQPVETERLYQTRLLDAEFSRVRITDPLEGLTWDRSVVFFPDLPCWIVSDAVLAERSAFRTLASLWWTTDLLEEGPDWYATRLRGVQDWTNPGEACLLVVAPPVAGQSRELSAVPFHRHFQAELALVNAWNGELDAGRYVNFVTVLWPHAPDGLDAQRRAGIEVLAARPDGRGTGVRLLWQGEERLVGGLNDLAVGIGEEDIRPSYSADRGMAVYGPAGSDAAFIYVRRSRQGGEAGFINGTRFELDGKRLYAGREHAMFQEDRTAQPGVPARFRWEGKFDGLISEDVEWNRTGQSRSQKTSQSSRWRRVRLPGGKTCSSTAGR